MKKKVDREAVYDMFGGRCAYCGNRLDKAHFQVDHIQHLYCDETDKSPRFFLRNENGGYTFPVCPRCAQWKGGHTLEAFRQRIEQQPLRLLKSSAPYRLAKDFGLIDTTETSHVLFWFEVYRNK